MRNREKHTVKPLPFLLTCLMLMLYILPGFAGALEDPNVAATAAILADPQSGMVLYQLNADEKRYPASTTKIMTALVTLERANLTDTITSTEEDFATLEPGGSNADIRVGETMTVHDLLYCLLLPSANEAANILARHVAGSQDAFVTLMNERAASLGCTGTNFVNTNGLHNEQHYTTARDLFRIASAAMENETFAEIANTAVKTIAATEFHDERKVYTTNYLILRKSDPAFYNYAKGIKTGSTSAAGNCLVSYAEKGGSRLISVVLGTERPSGQIAESFGESKRLFEWGFSNFTTMTLVEKGKTIEQIPIRLSTETDSLVLQSAAALEGVVPIDIDLDDVELDKILPDDLVAPVTAGQVIGSMKVSYNGVEYGTVDLVALNDVSVSKALYYADKLNNFFQSNLFKYIIIGCALLFILYLIIITIRNRRKKRRRRGMMRNGGRYRKR